MHQTQLILQIIASCDEALRDAFLRRMDAAVLIAKNKMEQGDAIYNPAQEEAVLRQITHDLAPDLRLRAESLWKNLTRMNRGRQYRYFITNSPDLKLIHEPDMLKAMPAGKVLCAARDAAAIEAACGMPTVPCDSSYDAIPRLLEGEAEYAALCVDQLYDTQALYSMIYNKHMYINNIYGTEDGRLVILMSRNIINSEDNSIVSVAFAIRMDQPGDLAQTLSIMAEAKMNLEYLQVKTNDIAADDSRNINIVFAEMSVSSLTATDVRTALLQMEQELPFFRVMGYRVSV